MEELVAVDNDCINLQTVLPDKDYRIKKTAVLPPYTHNMHHFYKYYSNGKLFDFLNHHNNFHMMVILSQKTSPFKKSFLPKF